MQGKAWMHQVRSLATKKPEGIKHEVDLLAPGFDLRAVRF